MGTLGGLILALLLSFNMGFTVTTPHPTNVVVRTRVTCSVGEGSHTVRHQFTARTPIRRTVPQSLPGATKCFLRVVAWDIHPWWGENGTTPVVHAWVT